jgi:rfaE bifunctional protein kinase chain/domain
MSPRNAHVSDLVGRVARFRGLKIAVLGDLVCDEFVHGDIERVSREAPVLILRHTKTEVVPGGGANAVANLRALGAEPFPVGVVGTDPAGEALLAKFRKAGIDARGIRRLPGYATPAKSRLLAGGVHTRRQQVIRIDRGAEPGDLDPPIEEDLLRRASRALHGASGLLVADYGYGAATPRLVRRLRQIHPALPMTVDSRNRVASFRWMRACTPNQEEVERAAGIGPLRSETLLRRAGHALLRRTGNGAVLVTRGALGMTLFARGLPPVDIPAFGSGEVADVTGAGDTVIAVFTLALLAGAAPVEAARLANYAAGLVVMKYGTATVSRSEIARAVREDLGR